MTTTGLLRLVLSAVRRPARAAGPIPAPHSGDESCGPAGPAAGPPPPGPVRRWAGRLAGVNWPLLGALALACYVIAPVLRTGYNGDDIINSYTRGAMAFQGRSFTEYAYLYARGWALGGRFFPMAFVETYGVFYLFPDYQTYKCVIAAAVLANILAFSYLIRLVTGSPGLAAAAAVLTAGTFQFRVAHDAIVGYSGLMQFVFLLLTVSLICLWKHLQTGRVWWLLPGALTYALGCLTYETSVALFVLHVSIILYHRRGVLRSAGAALPYVVVLAAYLSVWAYLRSQAADKIAPDNPYRLRTELEHVLPTYGRQVFAALPLSYAAAHPKGLMGLDAAADVLRGHRATVLAFFAVAAAAFYRAGRERAAWLGRPALLAGFIGLSLWLLAGAPVALVYRYQIELKLGIAHLPVYLEGYGVALLLALGLGLPAAAGGRYRVLAALAAAAPAAAAAAVLTVTADSNAAIAPLLAGNGENLDRRLNVEAALRAGLASDVPEYATVLVANEYPWWHDGLNGPHFFCQHTGKRLNVIGRPAVAAQPARPPFSDCYLAAGLPPVRRHLYEEVDFPLGRDRGFVVLCKLSAPPGWVQATTAAGTETRAATHVKVFVRGPGKLPPGFSLTARRAGGAGEAVVIPDREMDLLARGKGWAVYGVDCSARPIDTATLSPVSDQ